MITEIIETFITLFDSDGCCRNLRYLIIPATVAMGDLRYMIVAAMIAIAA
jgi:hypothetical protein